MRYVWLINGTEPLEALDALVKTNEKDSWTTAATGLQITAGANPAVPPVLYLSSTRACFDSTLSEFASAPHAREIHRSPSAT